LATLKRIEKIVRENAFDEKIKRPGLKFNPGLALNWALIPNPMALIPDPRLLIPDSTHLTPDPTYLVTTLKFASIFPVSLLHPH